MSVIAVLAIVCLVIWCGALTRRFADLGATRHYVDLPSDRSADGLDDRLVALSEAHRRTEEELEERVLELEERLDVAEQMLATARARGRVA